jgi:hypothetical protein
MPLDIQRLRDSDLAAESTPEECWAALLLWGAAWQQVPAASLPDNDRVLANLAGYGRVVEAWLKVRAGALRNFILCSDGRLYHPVVAEKALTAWTGKLTQRWRTECARIKKDNERNGRSNPMPSLDQFLFERGLTPTSGSSEVTCPPRQLILSLGTPPTCPEGHDIQEKGKGKGKGKGRPITPPTPLSGDDDLFDEGLAAYPETGRARTNPDKARALWAEHAILAGGQPTLLQALKAYSTSDSARLQAGRQVPSLQKWLGEGRYRAWASGAVLQVRMWTGPPDIWAAAVAWRGEDWARSWLLPCRWRDLPQPPTIIAPRQLTRDRLVDGLRELLKERGISVELESDQTRGAA